MIGNLLTLMTALAALGLFAGALDSLLTRRVRVPVRNRD
jgi:hypothetical protein